MKDKEVKKQFLKLYYKYLTHYLLFSETYPDLIENGNLDEYIKEGYQYYLYEIIEENKEENIYPLEIIYNFMELVLMIKDRSIELDDKNKNQEELYNCMISNLLRITESDYEIYYLEYIERYSSIKNIDKINVMSISDIKVDIQKDFKYLDMLNRNVEGKEEEFEEDFYNFLNKLLIDFEQIRYYPYLLNNIKHVLKYKNTKQSKDYLYLLEHKNNYLIKKGFDIESFEILYTSSFLNKIIYNESALKETENNKQLLFTVPMYYTLSIELEHFKQTNLISRKEQEQLSALLYTIRKNLSIYGGPYQKDFNTLVNEWIIFLNQAKIMPSELIYMEAQLKMNKSILNYIFSKDKAKIEEKTNKVMTRYFDILNYFITGKNDNLTDSETIDALNMIFKDYPYMFFDEQVHERSMYILNSNLKEQQKVKKKIEKIRKG